MFDATENNNKNEDDIDYLQERFSNDAALVAAAFSEDWKFSTKINTLRMPEQLALANNVWLVLMCAFWL